MSSSATEQGAGFAAMSGARKTRKSVPISKAVAVNTREVNVAVEGLDTRAIAGSFTVNLVKNGRRIASRFFFQAADSAGSPQSGPPLAHFDFFLPIDAVADGKLTIEIEPAESTLPGERPQLEQLGHPTLSVYLMLEYD